MLRTESECFVLPGSRARTSDRPAKTPKRTYPSLDSLSMYRRFTGLPFGNSVAITRLRPGSGTPTNTNPACSRTSSSSPAISVAGRGVSPSRKKRVEQRDVHHENSSISATSASRSCLRVKRTGVVM